ncbi:MAG: arginine decarboxylase, partial [Oscillospiraceae bacterium]|nr:arginine decarboxylase [Oscillospiraceae bacterium]
SIVLSPKEAFYGQQERVPIMESAGRISCEFVMCYPPGIPIIAPGELLTPEILENIDFSKKRGCFMTGTEDMDIEYIKVIK